MFSVVLALMLQPVTVAANASNTASVQPAVDVITRNFGAAAAAVFNLKLLDEGTACEVADEDGVTVSSAKAPCFAITQTGGKLTVSASSMSELSQSLGPLFCTYSTRAVACLVVAMQQQRKRRLQAPQYLGPPHEQQGSPP